MIIELPILPSNRAAKRYQMSFFHFSNNNLSIRRDCAQAIGGYDPDMRTAEDVEICFRVALSDRWVACREPGVVVRHKARRTLGGRNDFDCSRFAPACSGPWRTGAADYSSGEIHPGFVFIATRQTGSPGPGS